MFIDDHSTFELPHGLWIDGVCQRKAALRPLTGEDEQYLLEYGRRLWPAARVSALLARCLTSLGTLDLSHGDSLDMVRALTCGDREALLLRLRAATFGRTLISVLTCPHCEEKMDLEVNIAELLVLPYAASRPAYEAALEDGQGSYQVTLRLPTGADREAVASLAQSDAVAAGQRLLRRCLLTIAQDNQEPHAVTEETSVPADVLTALPALLAQLDEQAEILLNVTCPECSQAFTALFDAAYYLFQEADSRSTYLYEEVHQLAFHYHWSEAEIMGMTAAKRQRYLNLLADALGEMSG